MDNAKPITIPHDQNPQRCGYYGGKNTNGTPCGKWKNSGIPEGQGTGKCRRCCRFGAGAPIKHGRYSKKLKSALNERAHALIDSGFDVLNMQVVMAEMFVLRDDIAAMLDREQPKEGQETSNEGESAATMDFKALEGIFRLHLDYSREIGKMREREERIRASQALDARDVRALQQRWADIIMQFVPPEKHEALRRELYAAFNVTPAALPEQS